jgi:hypothetical protein
MDLNYCGQPHPYRTQPDGPAKPAKKRRSSPRKAAAPKPAPEPDAGE